MTEKEFHQIRTSYNGKKTKKTLCKEKTGYFVYLKMRCLICVILILSILVLDRQIGLNNYPQLSACMQLLGRDSISIEECISVINNIN